MHSKLKHIQSSRHSRYCESLKYSLHRTLLNVDIFTTYVYSSPSISRTKEYDGLFSVEPCVTLAYPEPETYPKPCQISLIENFIQNHV